MISFSEKELAELPVANIGQVITCPVCGGEHKLLGGHNRDGKETTQLLFYKCGGVPYFGGLLGRLTPSLVPYQEGVNNAI